MSYFKPKRIDQKDIDEMVEKTLSWILDFSIPESIILFGSAARGEMTEASDLDFALIYTDEKSAQKAQKHLRQRPPATLWPTDILYFSRSRYEEKKHSGGVCELIASEGRILYGGPL